LYTLGNPLRYTDPTGHFSEEQLNWLGYYRDNVDEDIWNFLLALQPGDELHLSHSEKVGGFLGLALRDEQQPGQAYQYGLFLFDNAGGVTELLQWLGNDLDRTFVFRDTPDGNQLVWSVYDGPVGSWSSPISQGGYIQTELGATQDRQFATLIKALLVIPLVMELFYFATSLDPGEAAGDIRMKFTYYDVDNEVYYTRDMWLRPIHSKEGPIPVIADTWFENLQ
jgi:hypothetical protein